MINLSDTGQILYISSVDISIGNGPGVNEREFVVGLYKTIGNRAHFLIPQPETLLNEVPESSCTFSRSHRDHHPLFLFTHIFSVILQANKILSRKKFDLLIFRLDVLPIAPLIITKKFHIAYAIKTLGQGSIKVLHEKGWLLGRLLQGINRWLFKKLVSNGLVADCDSTLHVEYMKKTLNINSDKVVWIDNAVNTNRFYPSSMKDAREALGLTNFNPIIGYVGTRPWERGAKQLIDVVPNLLEKYPNLGIVVLGDGKELAILKTRVKELHIEERCVFSGYVPFDRVPLYVNSLDLGVSISYREDRQVNAELKVRQYLACGKPIIISPGSNDFVAKENFGSIVQPTDLDAITTEIDRWLSLTVDSRNQFSHRASQYMENNLSINTAITKRLNIWNERLESHRSTLLQSGDDR